MYFKVISFLLSFVLPMLRIKKKKKNHKNVLTRWGSVLLPRDTDRRLSHYCQKDLTEYPVSSSTNKTCTTVTTIHARAEKHFFFIAQYGRPLHAAATHCGHHK